jgi:VanZ family protein
MITFRDFALFLGGAITMSSILMARIGLSNSVLSLRASAIYSGIGVGIGCSIFIFFTVGRNDLIGSVIVGVIAAFIGGVTTIFMQNHKDKKPA